jgi:hypothetical protein
LVVLLFYLFFKYIFIIFSIIFYSQFNLKNLLIFVFLIKKPSFSPSLSIPRHHRAFYSIFLHSDVRIEQIYGESRPAARLGPRTEPLQEGHLLRQRGASEARRPEMDATKSSSISIRLQHPPTAAGSPAGNIRLFGPCRVDLVGLPQPSDRESAGGEQALLGTAASTALDSFCMLYFQKTLIKFSNLVG